MKSRKGLKLILLSLVMLIPLFVFAVSISPKMGIAHAAYENTAHLKITGTNSYRTDYTGDITLMVKLENFTSDGIWSCVGNLNYDKNVFEYQSSTLKVSGWTGSINNITTGAQAFLRMPYTDGEVNLQTAPSFDVVEVKFKLKPGASAGTYTFSFSNLDIASYNLNTFEEIQVPASSENFDITLTAPSNNASLSTSQPISVAVSGGTTQTLQVSSGTTSGNTTSFTLPNAVPYSVTKNGLNITATKADTKASMQITGASANEIKNGSRKATITVTAEDGTTKHNYEINFTVQSASNEAKLTGNVVLTKKAESTSSGTITIPVADFTPKGGNVYEYTIAEALEYKITSLDVATATPSANATKSVSGTSLSYQNTNQVKIVVTAEDGTTKSTYQINVNRTAPVLEYGAFVEIVDKNNNTIDITTLDKYILDMSSTPFKLNVSAVASSSKATVKINGSNYTPGTEYTVNQTGDITISIIVEAEDKSSRTITKTISVGNNSADTSLKGVKIFYGSQELTVRFLQGSYKVQLPSWDVKNIRVQVETNDSSAIVTILALAENSDQALQMCDNNQLLEISSQIKRLQVLVQLGDGTEKSHEIQVIWPLNTNDNYVAFGGDCDISISEADFNDGQVSASKPQKIKSSTFDFYVEKPEGMEVEVFFGGKKVEGNESFANGSSTPSMHFNVNNLKAGNNAVVVQLTDTETGIVKVCVLNLERPAAKPTAMIIAIAVLSVALVGAIVATTMVGLKKGKNGGKGPKQPSNPTSDEPTNEGGVSAPKSAQKSTSSTVARATKAPARSSSKSAAKPTTITIKTR